MATSPDLRTIKNHWRYIQGNIRLEDGQADSLDSLQSYLEIKFSVLAMAEPETAGREGSHLGFSTDEEEEEEGKEKEKTREVKESDEKEAKISGGERKSKNETEMETETENETDSVVADTETEEEEAKLSGGEKERVGGEREIKVTRLGIPKQKPELNPTTLTTFEDAKEFFAQFPSQTPRSSFNSFSTSSPRTPPSPYSPLSSSNSIVLPPSSTSPEEELVDFYSEGLFWRAGNSYPAKTFVSKTSIYVLTNLPSLHQSTHVFPFHKMVGIGRSDASGRPLKGNPPGERGILILFTPTQHFGLTGLPDSDKILAAWQEKWEKCVNTSLVARGGSRSFSGANSYMHRLSEHHRDILRQIIRRPTGDISNEVSCCYPPFWRLPAVTGPRGLLLEDEGATLWLPQDVFTPIRGHVFLSYHYFCFRSENLAPSAFHHVFLDDDAAESILSESASTLSIFPLISLEEITAEQNMMRKGTNAKIRSKSGWFLYFSFRKEETFSLLLQVWTLARLEKGRRNRSSVTSPLSCSLPPFPSSPSGVVSKPLPNTVSLRRRMGKRGLEKTGRRSVRSVSASRAASHQEIESTSKGNILEEITKETPKKESKESPEEDSKEAKEDAEIPTEEAATEASSETTPEITIEAVTEGSPKETPPQKKDTENIENTTPPPKSPKSSNAPLLALPMTPQAKRRPSGMKKRSRSAMAVDYQNRLSWAQVRQRDVKHIRMAREEMRIGGNRVGKEEREGEIVERKRKDSVGSVRYVDPKGAPEFTQSAKLSSSSSVALDFPTDAMSASSPTSLPSPSPPPSSSSSQPSSPEESSSSCSPLLSSPKSPSSSSPSPSSPSPPSSPSSPSPSPEAASSPSNSGDTNWGIKRRSLTPDPFRSPPDESPPSSPEFSPIDPPEPLSTSEDDCPSHLLPLPPLSTTLLCPRRDPPPKKFRDWFLQFYGDAEFHTPPRSAPSAASSASASCPTFPSSDSTSSFPGTPNLVDSGPSPSRVGRSSPNMWNTTSPTSPATGVSSTTERELTLKWQQHICSHLDPSISPEGDRPGGLEKEDWAREEKKSSLLSTFSSSLGDLNAADKQGKSPAKSSPSPSTPTITRAKEQKKATPERKAVPFSFSRCMGSDIIRTVELLSLIKEGIPNPLRSLIWQMSSGSSFIFASHPHELREGGGSRDPSFLSYFDYLRENKDKSSASTDDIDRDLHRTLPSHPFFKTSSGLDSLRRVLVAYSWKNPDVGYCQSLNVIVALLLCYLTEEQTFWMVSCICEEILPDRYTPSMIGTMVDQQAFQTVVETELPDVVYHLDEIGVPLPLITLPWFMCMFIGYLPWECVLRTLDHFFAEGVIVLYRVSLAVLYLHRSAILMESDPMAVINMLKHRVRVNTADVFRLVHGAYSELITARSISDLREFHYPEILVQVEEQQGFEAAGSSSSTTTLSSSSTASFTSSTTSIGSSPLNPSSSPLNPSVSSPFSSAASSSSSSAPPPDPYSPTASSKIESPPGLPTPSTPPCPPRSPPPSPSPSLSVDDSPPKKNKEKEEEKGKGKEAEDTQTNNNEGDSSEDEEAARQLKIKREQERRGGGEEGEERSVVMLRPGHSRHHRRTPSIDFQNHRDEEMRAFIAHHQRERLSGWESSKGGESERETFKGDEKEEEEESEEESEELEEEGGDSRVGGEGAGEGEGGGRRVGGLSLPTSSLPRSHVVSVVSYFKKTLPLTGRREKPPTQEEIMEEGKKK